MVIVESAVMFFEVIFLYRELIDAITPWIAQQSGGEFVHIIDDPDEALRGDLRRLAVAGSTLYVAASACGVHRLDVSVDVLFESEVRGLERPGSPHTRR